MDRLLFLLGTVNRAITAGSALMFERVGVSFLVLEERAVEVLLEDWLNFDVLELGLEVFGTLKMRGRVGTTARVDHVDVADIINLVSWMAPEQWWLVVAVALVNASAFN